MNSPHESSHGKQYRLHSIASFVLLLLLAASLVACGESDSTAPGATPAPTLERSRGETLFIRYCNVCHPGGGMGSGPSLKMLPLSKEDVSSYIRHGKGRMPAFGTDSISDEQLVDLVDYVLALR